MKRIVPEHEIEECDQCSTVRNFLQDCLVCGKQLCLTCSRAVAGCIVPFIVCADCLGCDDVRDLVSLYASKLTPIVQERNAKLAQLRNVTGGHACPRCGAWCDCNPSQVAVDSQCLHDCEPKEIPNDP